MINKKDLVTRVALQGGFTKGATEQFIDALSTVVATALVEGEAVKIGSIVTLEAVDVAEAIKKNPKTQEEVTVDAHRKVKAKVSQTIKDLVR